MALTINTNIASLTAQRNLSGSQDALSTSLERLSTGLRINSAKDDAAGLAISERFTAQIRGMNQGVRNANDAISLSQTAEGALKEVTNNLQRIRELAVQSVNSSNSASDRTALQAEVTQLVAEIDRVAEKTKFNGINLLDGSFTSKSFQVGADASETVSIGNIASMRTSAIGGSFSATATSDQAVGTTALTTTTFLNGIQLNATVSDGHSTANATASAKAKAASVNSTAGHNVTATASTSTAGTTMIGNATIVNGTITINGVATATITLTATATTSGDAVVAGINAISGSTGVTASHTAGRVIMNAADGRNIVHSFTDGGLGGGFDGTKSGVGAGATTTGKIAFTSTDAAGIKISASAGGAKDATESAKLGFSAAQETAAEGSGVAMSVVSVGSASDATAAITAIDNALNSVNSTRASLGASQSRFMSISSSLQTSSENISASRSRILDADFAAETAAMTKSQIMQQSGIAMLAQANSIPQNVLALLQ